MRFSISHKFLLVFAVLAALGIANWFVMESIVGRVINAMDLVNKIGGIRWMSQRIQIETIRNRQGKADPAAIDGWMRSLETTLRELSDDRSLQAYDTRKPWRATLTSLRALVGKYRASVEEVLAEGRDPIIPERNLEQLFERSNEMLRQANALVTALTDEIKYVERRHALLAITSLLVLDLLALLLALLAIRRGFVGPLQMLARASRSLSEGGDEVNVSHESGDELGELARAFNRMSVNIREQQRQNADHLARIEKSRFLLDKILDNLPVGILIIDQTGQMIIENAERRAIWCTPVSPRISLALQTCVAWRENGERLVAGDWPIERALTAGEPTSGEVFSIQAFDGVIKTVLMSAAPLIDGEGARVGAIGVMKDITIRQRAVEELRISKELFQTCFDSAATGVALFDLSGRFLMTNGALCEMLGYAERELLCKCLADIMLPDDFDLEAVLAERPPLRKSSAEVSFVGSDGSIFEAVLFLAVADGRDAQPLYLVGHVLDISERKRMEEELIGSRKLLRELAAHHDAVREAERKRIALEIHDELGQLLTALKMDISLIQLRHGEDPWLAARAAQMNTLVEQTIGVVRNLAVHLRPPVLDLGIIPGDAMAAGGFSTTHGHGLQSRTLA